MRGWRPVFTAGNQRLLRFSLQWIDSMMQPRPDYPVDYEPPRIGEIARPTDRTDR